MGLQRCQRSIPPNYTLPVRKDPLVGLGIGDTREVNMETWMVKTQIHRIVMTMKDGMIEIDSIYNNETGGTDPRQATDVVIAGEEDPRQAIDDETPHKTTTPVPGKTSTRVTESTRSEDEDTTRPGESVDVHKFEFRHS